MTPPNRMLLAGHGDVEPQMAQGKHPERFAERFGFAHLLQQIPQRLRLQTVDFDVQIFRLRKRRLRISLQLFYVLVPHAAAHEIGAAAAFRRQLRDAPGSLQAVVHIHRSIVSKRAHGDSPHVLFFSENQISVAAPRSKRLSFSSCSVCPCAIP